MLFVDLRKGDMLFSVIGKDWWLVIDILRDAFGATITFIDNQARFCTNVYYPDSALRPYHLLRVTE